MKSLWDKAFELFRRNPILWAPCCAAGLVTLALARLQKAEVHWLLSLFATQHSVLGGDVPSDLTLAQHRVAAIAVPLGLLREVVDVLIFVIALAMTGKLVGTILEDQSPEIMAALKAIAPQWRSILLLSLKYILILGLMGGALIVLGRSPLTPGRIHEVILSKTFSYAFGLVGEACLAWLLMPATIRLLQPQDGPHLSSQSRKMGVAFAIAATAAGLALENLLRWTESTVVYENRWEMGAVAAWNTIAGNAPLNFLFILLALIASGLAEESKWQLEPGPDTPPTEPAVE
jgi:hypothetical protein